MWCLSRNVAEKRCMRNCGKALRLVTRRLSATSPYHPRLFCPFSVSAPLTPPSHAWRRADIVWAMDRSIGWTGQPG